MSFQLSIVQKIITITEKLTFYPKLKKFYVQNLPKRQLRIIDVGANKGQSIDFFRSINPEAHILAYEPNKSLVEKLNGKYNKWPNIVIRNEGISNKIGSLLFHENVLDETSTFETLNENSLYLKRKAQVLGVRPDELILDKYNVEVTTLSIVIQEQDLSYIDVVKIDVEGHEYQCLEGLFNSSSKSIPVSFIQLEYHEDDMYLNKRGIKEYEHLLLENGFKEAKRIKHAFGDFYDVIYKNINPQE